MALLEAGASVERTHNGKTELMWAADTGSAARVRALLGARACVDRSSPLGDTALTLACRHGHELCVRALLQAGAAAGEPGRDNRPLHAAARGGHAECLVALAEAGVDVDGRRLHSTRVVLGATGC
jgi:ankyrin repeat protein